MVIGSPLQSRFRTVCQGSEQLPAVFTGFLSTGVNSGFRIRSWKAAQLLTTALVVSSFFLFSAFSNEFALNAVTFE